MLPELDNITIFLGAITLAVLSIYTIEKCRQDTTEHLSRRELFLFLGKTRMHSLAGNLGAVFSATYFFGATFIYGLIFRGTLVLVTAIIFSILTWLVPKIIAQASLVTPTAQENVSNPLLEFLRARLGLENFRLIINLYLLIYFALLVEEIAVSRLILWTLFPFHPAVATAMLATICFVVLAYIYYGGFRAILISDLEQLKIIAPFLLLLLFFVFTDSPQTTIDSFLSFPHILDIWGIIFALIFGVAWFSAGVDYYSRLNFPLSTSENPVVIKKIFSRISLVLIFLLLLGGMLFGGHLVTILPKVKSPSSYTQVAMSYFLTQNSRIVILIFFLALFCMLFTTINTLVITILQVGHYSSHTSVKRENLVRIFLLAVILSCAIPFDAVSAVGIYFGSLLILPLFAIIQSLSGRPSRLFPGGVHYLWLALFGSLIIFTIFFERLELDFEKHFLISGIVTTCVICALLLHKMVESFWRRANA